MKTSRRAVTRRDLHAEITRSIIEAIENGPGDFTLPWHRSGSIGRPRNAVTKQPYNGVNIVSLWVASELGGYTTPLWATYRQWQSIGAQVRKGETSSLIVFYKTVDIEAQGDDGALETETRLFARCSRVFNAEQVDGFEIVLPAQATTDQIERIVNADALVAASGADIRHGGERACYVPSADFIRMPPRERFTGTAISTATESYYSTFLHELTHWTGHPARCARDLTGRFGDQAYAMEELVADLGAAFLCGDLGITPSPRADHAAYLANWLEVLKNDTKAIFTAASKASEAAEFLSRLSAPDPRPSSTD